MVNEMQRRNHPRPYGTRAEATRALRAPVRSRFFRFELRAAPRRTRRQSAERKISAQTRLLAGAGRRPRAARMERRPLRKRSIPRQGVKFPSILLLSGQEMHTTMIDAILKHRPLTAINFAIILLTTRKHVGNTPIFLRLD